jgi:hypothetical protein
LLVYIFYGISQLFGFTPSNNGTNPPTKFEKQMLILGLILLGGYFLWFYFLQSYLQNKYLKQGGKQLINQPIPTDILTNVASYQNLNDSDKWSYQYAMSFWFYLDAFPPSTSSSYSKIVPILSYGENPSIKYNSNDNTIYITVNQHEQLYDANDNAEKLDKKRKNIENTNDFKEWLDIKNEIKLQTQNSENIKENIEKIKTIHPVELNDEGHRVIYKHPNVLLQKWNHIVLNYNGGTLDVFYNGKLVKSAIEVVPYMKFDTLSTGFQNGVSGNIANLLYFKQPIDILTIHTLYNSLKDKNPPSISENQKQLIPLPNNI